MTAKEQKRSGAPADAVSDRPVTTVKVEVRRVRAKAMRPRSWGELDLLSKLGLVVFLAAIVSAGLIIASRLIAAII
jgi:hypothetical protein